MTPASGRTTDLDDIPTLGDDGRKVHVFITPPDRRPQAGDVALCGVVKRGTARFPSNAAARGSGVDRCPSCARLAQDEAARGRRFAP